MPGAQYYDGSKLVIPITHEAGIALHDHWMQQGVSTLISAIAQQKIKELSEHYKHQLQRCSSRAQSVYEHARCLVATLDINAKSVRSKRQR
ncbi:unnamed protein product [Toxocara canis]|uniref:Transposase n=1 Tax=Toxocara canis TaxID=6265 RepID=A0A183TYB4_TOXCA|nr:unnamed protein product [Toxocara canis]